MPRAPFTSKQSAAVLAAFMRKPQAWRYGYDLLQELGLKSGTLYPLLMRLKDYDLLAAEWHDATKPGRPPRHAYRLTPDGIAFATSQASAAQNLVLRIGSAVIV